jgi:general secretion pathway protein E
MLQKEMARMPENEEEQSGVATRPDSEETGISRINVLRQAPTPDALKLLPESLAIKYRVVPLSVENSVLRVAMADPDDILALEALSALTKKKIETVAADEKDIREAIDFNYKAFGSMSKYVNSIEASSRKDDVEMLKAEAADDSPVAQVLTMIVEEAVKSRASDIHIEPDEKRLRVRYRIDGILHDVISLPTGVLLPLTSRIKILSNMNIADRLRPQDGQFSVNTKGKNVDIRVAIINTIYGEMSVLRLLDKTLGTMSLSQLGLLPDSQEKMEKMLTAPYGMILISGPTGSGKTTTLYASVNSLDRVGNNIITIEDPVEYRFENINQIQVNPKGGVTFASGLRAIVRLDPDIILVGEIRDKETAEIAIQSALTGHLVLSSVHANDTVNVVFRLIDLGVEPFLISSGVIGVVAQRMVRRICPYCARPVTAPLVERMAYQQVMGEQLSEFMYGAGCKACTYTGYLGRTGIFEILTITDTIRQLLIDRAPAARIREQAIKENLVSMARDGMMKVKKGLTTPYEVLRNIQIND